jgi:hypothetical protein
LFNGAGNGKSPARHGGNNGQNSRECAGPGFTIFNAIDGIRRAIPF